MPAYPRHKPERRTHERRRTRGAGGRRVGDAANGGLGGGSKDVLHLDDPGAVINCPWCGVPLHYVGSADRGRGDASQVHVYDCRTDGRVFLIPAEGFTRRRPRGWIPP